MIRSADLPRMPLLVNDCAFGIRHARLKSERDSRRF
jgi:hypothetical protein